MSNIGFNVAVSKMIDDEVEKEYVSIESISTIGHDLNKDETKIIGADGLILGGVVCPTFSDAKSAAIDIAQRLSALDNKEVKIEFWYKPDDMAITLYIAKNGKVTKQ